jgi:hypothetical protein
MPIRISDCAALLAICASCTGFAGAAGGSAGAGVETGDSVEPTPAVLPEFTGDDGAPGTVSMAGVTLAVAVCGCSDVDRFAPCVAAAALCCDEACVSAPEQEELFPELLDDDKLFGAKFLPGKEDPSEDASGKDGPAMGAEESLGLVAE